MTYRSTPNALITLTMKAETSSQDCDAQSALKPKTAKLATNPAVKIAHNNRKEALVLLLIRHWMTQNL